MTPKEAIEKIKAAIGLSETPETKLATAKLLDGTEISYDELIVGSMIYDAEGAPLADGEYVMEDNTKLVVAAGAIAEIVAPESEVEVTVEAEAEVEAAITPDSPVEDAVSLINSLEERVIALEGIVAELVGAVQANMSETEAKLSEIASAPSAVSVTMGAQPAAEKTRFERISQALDAMAKSK